MLSKGNNEIGSEAFSQEISSASVAGREREREKKERERARLRKREQVTLSLSRHTEESFLSLSRYTQNLFFLFHGTPKMTFLSLFPVKPFGENSITPGVVFWNCLLSLSLFLLHGNKARNKLRNELPSQIAKVFLVSTEKMTV